MVDKLEKIWLDGKLIDQQAATVHLLTHTLHYGVGVFEGIRAYKRADGKTYVFRLKEHIDRLFDGCKLTLMKCEFSREQVMAACVDVLRANKLDEGYLRPIVFVGDGAMGVYAPEQPHPHRDRRVEVGHVPRRRRAQARHSREDQLVRAPPRERLRSPRARSPASTPTASSPSAKPSSPATTRP